jgi:Ca2+-binding EF-hand superfamily protein
MAEDDNQLREVFDQIDTDKSNGIDLSEFSILLDKLGNNLTDEEKKDTFNLIDVSKNNIISFEEFRDWWNAR